MKLARFTVAKVCSALFVSVVCLNVASGYSVLTHEAIVDAAWDISIRPLLMQRFPNATPEELKTAHGYAYGGLDYFVELLSTSRKQVSDGRDLIFWL